MLSTPAQRRTRKLCCHFICRMLISLTLVGVIDPATPRRRAKRYHPYFTPSTQSLAPQLILSTPQSPLLRCSLCNRRPQGPSVRLLCGHALCAHHLRMLCSCNAGVPSVDPPIPALDLRSSLLEGRSTGGRYDASPMQGASPPTPASQLSYDTSTSNESLVTDPSVAARQGSPRPPSPVRPLVNRNPRVPAHFYKANYTRYPTEDEDLGPDHGSFSFPSIPRCPSTVPEEPVAHSKIM